MKQGFRELMETDLHCVIRIQNSRAVQRSLSVFHIPGQIHPARSLQTCLPGDLDDHPACRPSAHLKPSIRERGRVESLGASDLEATSELGDRLDVYSIK